MKSEVIMQKKHMIGYAHAIRNCGVKIIEVETRKELEKAINDKTAMMWFFNGNNFVGESRMKNLWQSLRNMGYPPSMIVPLMCRRLKTYGNTPKWGLTWWLFQEAKA